MKRKLVFAEKINNTEDTGIIDISCNPPELICLCTKQKSVEIISAFEKQEQSRNDRYINANIEINKP